LEIVQQARPAPRPSFVPSILNMVDTGHSPEPLAIKPPFSLPQFLNCQQFSFCIDSTLVIVRFGLRGGPRYTLCPDAVVGPRLG
jgi:hypothetical protein